jgi:hypothetical protein
MFGPDFALKHHVSEEHYRDLLAASEHQRRVALALATRPRRERLSEARTIIATILHRAADRLMPDNAPGTTGQPATTLSLRPGR